MAVLQASVDRTPALSTLAAHQNIKYIVSYTYSLFSPTLTSFKDVYSHSRGNKSWELNATKKSFYHYQPNKVLAIYSSPNDSIDLYK